MYEPKYKLNQRDAKRYHELLIRHCLEAPNKTPAQKRMQRKYPPLTKAENIEFEKLERKSHRKVAAHPKVKASIRRSYRQLRKIRKAADDLERLMKRLKIKVD